MKIRKLPYFICMIMTLLTCVRAFSQETITGKVVDPKHQPVQWADVALSDSIEKTVNAAITDSLGMFSIGVKDRKNLKLKISCLGYKTRIISLPTVRKNAFFIMYPDSSLLSEVIVKGYRHPFHIQGDIFIADVAGTLLSESGSLEDLANKIPFLSVSNGDFVVFGRGDAVVYLNGQRVYNNYQLDGLTSKQIKNIELITNPGPKYKSDVKAIVKIYTVKQKDDGIGSTVSFRMAQGRKTTGSASGSFYYRSGNLDLNGSLAYSRLASRNRWEDKTLLMSTPTSQTVNRSEILNHGNVISSSVGGNYHINDSSNVGLNTNLLYYKIDNSINMPGLVHEVNNTVVRSTPASAWSGDKPFQVLADMYYTVKVAKTDLVATNEFLRGYKTNDFDYQETVDKVSINTQSKMHYLMNSTMLDFHTSIGKFNLSYGSELTYSNDDQTFDYNQQHITTPLQTSNNKREQFLGALYLGSGYRKDNFGVDFGGRYEYVKFNYYENHLKSREQSRNYTNFLPYINFDISFTQKCKLSVGLRSVLTRPSYSLLNDRIQTDDRYTYKQGNSLLHPELDHSLNGLFSIEDFKVIAQYNIIKDQAMRPRMRYDDEDIILDKIINLPTYQTCSLGLSWTKTFGFYTPYIEASSGKQNFTYDFMGSKYDFKRPYFNFRVNNTFSLHNNVKINGLFGYNSKRYITFIENSYRWYSTISISKSFRCGLFMQLGVNNIPGTRLTRQVWRTNDIYDTSANCSDNRSVFLMIVYSLKSKVSRYMNRRKTSELRRF